MKILAPAELADLSDERLLTYLSSVRKRLSTVTAEQEALWQARIDVYQEGRSRTPVITHGRLAEAAGVSEVAIITKLRQLHDRAEASTG